jgi:hypothetical protein
LKLWRLVGDNLRKNILVLSFGESRFYMCRKSSKKRVWFIKTSSCSFQICSFFLRHIDECSGICKWVWMWKFRNHMLDAFSQVWKLDLKISKCINTYMITHLSVYLYQIYMCVCVCVCVYIYRERERERENMFVICGTVWENWGRQERKREWWWRENIQTCICIWKLPNKTHQKLLKNGRKGKRVIEGVNVIKVKYIHVWKTTVKTLWTMKVH